MDLTLAESLDDLPAGSAGLFPDDPLAGPEWFRAVASHALPPGASACFAVLTERGRPCAIVPLRRDGVQLGGLTSPYTCVYWPLLAPGADASTLHSGGRCFGRFCRAWATVRLDAIPAEWPGLASFVAGLREAGLRVQEFEHFGNWYEPVDGRGWAEYLACRSGALRETLRRKLKRGAGVTRLERFDGLGDVERGIDAFETVYRASWKEPEPFPRFNAALMRAAAGKGTLRLAVLWAQDRPAAAQFWIVGEGRARVLKLAHDEAFKTLSPGTVLTAMMVRGLLDDERVAELDFGRGDDPYKALWTTQRRRRIGLLVINPWRPSGLAALARGAASRVRAAALRTPMIHRPL